MGFAPIVVWSVASVNDAPKLAAAINAQRNNFLVEWRPVRMFRGLSVIAGIGQEHPSGPPDIADRGMLPFAIGSEVSDHAVFKTAFDDVKLVRLCLADTDIHVVAVGVDRHVAMTWAMMLGPPLNLGPVDGEDMRDFSSIRQRLKTQYVLPGWRN